MTEGKKSRAARTSITMTAMIAAINDMYVATLDESDVVPTLPCSVLLRRSNDGENYNASLWKHVVDEEPQHVMEEESVDGFEGAVSLLLQKMSELLDYKKKAVLAELNDVSEKYRVVLRGARSRVKRPSGAT